MGVVQYFSSNFGFYVYSQVVNDPANHRYRVDSQAVLQVKSSGITTVASDWVSIVVDGVTHKVYLPMKYRGVGNHTLYSRSDYYSYRESARTVVVNAYANIDGKVQLSTGRTYGPGECDGYANYESLPGKYPTGNIDLVKGAFDNNSIVATCKNIVANRGYNKTVRWYLNGAYKAEDHLAEGTTSCNNTFTGLAAGTNYDIRARVFYRYNGDTDYDEKLQEKEETWSTAAIAASGGSCEVSAITKTSAKISLTGLVRNYAFAVDAKVYLGGVLKNTIAMASSVANAAYTFTGLTPGTAYSAQIKIYSTGGTLLKTYPAIAFTTQELDLVLTENPVLEVSTPALGSVKFDLTNIKRNVPFAIRIEYKVGDTTKSLVTTASAASKSFTFTGVDVAEVTEGYTVKLIDDGTDDVLKTFTGTVALAYVNIDYGQHYKTDLTRTNCTVNIPDIVYETVPAGLPCVLSFDFKAVSEYDSNIVLCDIKDQAITGDSISFSIANWDFQEGIGGDFIWKANGLVAVNDYFHDDGVTLYAGYGDTPEILNLHQTGCTVYLGNAIARYGLNQAEIELENPEDVDEDGTIVYPGVFDILWHVRITNVATGQLVKYAKVGPEHGEAFTYVVTGLKPNTEYSISLGNAPVCRNYDYQNDWYTDPMDVTFTTLNYALTARTFALNQASPLALTFKLKTVQGNSEFPIKLKIYLDDVLRLTTGEVPVEVNNPVTCWAIIDGLSKAQTGTYKVEIIECVTNGILETLTGNFATWDDPYLGWMLLRNYKWYWMVQCGFPYSDTPNEDEISRKYVFPELRYKMYFRPSQMDPTYPRKFLFAKHVNIPASGLSLEYEMTDAYLPDENGYVIINKQNFPALDEFCWRPVQMFICDPDTNEIIISTTDMALGTVAQVTPSNIGPDEGPSVIPEVI